MKRSILMLILPFLMLTPNLSHPQNEWMALAEDVNKQATNLESILDDVDALVSQIHPLVSQEEALNNSLLSQVIYRIYIVYDFTSVALRLTNGGILRDGIIDECKDKMCKEMVQLHYFLESRAKYSAKTHLEVALRQLRFLTIKIKNARLSYQLNKVIDITSSTLELINKTESK
jgi:hypothetical protein